MYIFYILYMIVVYRFMMGPAVYIHTHAGSRVCAGHRMCVHTFQYLNACVNVDVNVFVKVYFQCMCECIFDNACVGLDFNTWMHVGFYTLMNANVYWAMQVSMHISMR